MYFFLTTQFVLSVVYFACNCISRAAYTFYASVLTDGRFCYPQFIDSPPTSAHRFASTSTFMTRFWILYTNCYQSNRLTIELHHFFLMKQVLAVYLFLLSSLYWYPLPSQLGYHLTHETFVSFLRGGACAHAACRLGALWRGLLKSSA